MPEHSIGGRLLFVPYVPLNSACISIPLFVLSLKEYDTEKLYGKPLRWIIFIRTDPAGNIKPDKEKSTEKIDGAVATIMALDRAIQCGNDNGASVYDSRGLLFI